ncbi:MAG TPA: hypothetical protein VLH56_00025 [Dissulfurispiraceae bacterium]|nr:hypothetical protein [Dissulfurispiraceae bacterium]
MNERGFCKNFFTSAFAQLPNRRNPELSSAKEMMVRSDAGYAEDDTFSAKKRNVLPATVDAVQTAGCGVAFSRGGERSGKK